jgi:hypothetical protein
MLSKKLTYLAAVGVTALFLGAMSLHAQTEPPTTPPDADGDGVPDDTVLCPDTDLTATTVVIDGVDTGITNSFNEATGCTFAQVVEDIFDDCAANAKNHGKFVSCVARETNAMKRLKIITGKQKGKLQSLAAHTWPSSPTLPPVQ